jgi:glycosyltransferase involved in cell wall biosynthesis
MGASVGAVRFEEMVRLEPGGDLMKILEVVPSFYPAHIYGGPIQSLYHLCRSLADQGCDVKVLTTNANGPTASLDVDTRDEVELDGRFRVRYCRRLLFGSVSWPLLMRLPFYTKWADVIHLTSVYSFPTLPALLLARVLGKPVVWSPRGSLQRWEGSSRVVVKGIWEVLCRLLAPREMVLHVTSEEEATQSVEKMPRTRTCVITNGIHVAGRRKPGSFLPDGVLRLVYIGRIHPIKGLENLFSACHLLQMKWMLSIAGTGEPKYMQDLQSRIELAGLQSKIRMLGPILGQEKDTLLENSDLLVLPSHSENFGMVVAEALAHGVPVIAGHGTPWKGLEDRQCGIWTANDPPSLAAAIERAASMPLWQMGEAGRDWMLKEFSWQGVAGKMSELYSEVRQHASRM